MTDRPYLLQDLLTASATATPEAVAVVDRDRSITYGDLDAVTNRLARSLAGLGVRKGDRVALYLDKSLESVIAVYGIMKAGAAYVPLDPQAPPARLAKIAGNAGARVLCTGIEKNERWPELIAEGARFEALVVLNSDEAPAPSDAVRVLTRGDVDATDASPFDGGVIDLDLAYILYTSGSTGDPKGVKLSHLNAMTFVNWTVEHYGVTDKDRLSSHAPLHFDLSVFDLYAAAHAGAAVVLVPPETSVFPREVASFIERNEISIWYSVPSILSLMTIRGKLERGAFPTLRVLLFAGEAFPTKYLRALMDVLPHVRFANLYGPTETNVCTFYDVPPLDPAVDDPIPIGMAIDNVDVFAVDEDRIVGTGEVGELWVRGTTVMQGYWADEEKTSKVLFPNPFSAEVKDPVYRTGDLVRLREDGHYELLGRRDAQIKSRGYRIELGDIESALYSHPDVLECAVTPIPDEVVTNRIKAFVVVRNDIGKTDLVRFCSERLPKYMVPDIFDFSDSLPKTSTGKIDRQQLKAVDRGN